MHVSIYALNEWVRREPLPENMRMRKGDDGGMKSGRFGPSLDVVQHVMPNDRVPDDFIAPQLHLVLC